MKQIRLRIMGGLGNQLYQYAAARYMQIKYNNPELIIDTGEYETYKTRKLELNSLLHNESAKFENKGKFRGFVNEFFHIYQRVYHYYTKKHAKQIVYKIFNKTYICSSVEFIPVEKINSSKLNMYGYFASAQPAIKIRKILKQEIYLDDVEKTLEYKNLKTMIDNKSVIAVSIRCQDDYIKNGWPVCSKEYYLKGIKKILSEKYLMKQIPILIFADDIRKVKSEEWFIECKNVYFVEGLNVCQSFELLRNCSDYVCSNSSFSWWGAFLSYTDNPMIINPNKIYGGNNVEDDERTFYDNLIFLDYQSGEETEKR